jgi:hypothetical protein
MNLSYVNLRKSELIEVQQIEHILASRKHSSFQLTPKVPRMHLISDAHAENFYDAVYSINPGMRWAATTYGGGF